MIQRIQSIFLLFASLAFFSLFSNLMSFATSEPVASATSVLSDGIFNIHDNTGLIFLTVLGGVLALLAIFLFNNRSLQMKISNFTILAGLSTVGFLGFLISKETSTFEIGFGLAAPILAIVFSALATRFIKKDDKVVKSMDRLR